MSNKPLSTLEKDQLIRSAYLYAADMMKYGMSTDDMEQNLIKRGLGVEVASMVIRNLRNARRKA